MAPRAYWTGHLRLSLVSVPVRLYTATSSSHKLALHQVHKPTGERVRYQYTVPGHGPVERDEIVKGYEYEKGRFVLLETDEIEDLKVESKKTVEIVQFVDSHEIDPIYYEKPYFVVPDGDLADEAFIVIRNALKDTKKIGIGQVVISGKEHIASIRPCGRGLILETLRYEDEVRDADKYFDDVEEVDVDPDQLDLAKELIKRKSSPFDPSKFEDHYQGALKELVKAKIEHRPADSTVGGKPPRGGNVVNLMDALKKSLQTTEGGSGTKKTAGRSGAKPGAKPAASKSTKAKATKASTTKSSSTKRDSGQRKKSA